MAESKDNDDVSDTLGANQTLDQECFLKSTNNAYFAKMQKDGNFVVYVSPHFVPSNALWSSGTHQKGSGPYRLVMQEDRNLVVYDGYNKALWSTNTAGKGQSPGKLVMQEDGNLVMYDKSGNILWQSNTVRK